MCSALTFLDLRYYCCCCIRLAASFPQQPGLFHLPRELCADSDSLPTMCSALKPLQYCCNALPISCSIDQRRLTFWHKIQNSNNTVLRTLSSSKHHSFVAIAVKYGISSHNVSFRKAVWQASFSFFNLFRVHSVRLSRERKCAENYHK